jgi:outer membrane receptor protein involved in Fe transport
LGIHHNRRVRASKFLLLVGAASLVLASAATAQTQRSFAIPAQDATAAFQAYAKQSGKQVLFPYDAVAGKKTPEIRGDFSDAEALARLAAAAGLVITSDNGRTVTLQARPSGANTSVKEEPPAGGAPANPGEVYSIVTVTAQKRRQNAQDVPISIAALGNREISQLHMTDIDDLNSAAPGVSIQTSSDYQRRIAIRGVSNIAGTSSTIGMYLGDADVTGFGQGVASQIDIQAYDLNDIEVLRGPQGTLYGQGSIGGTIRFIPNQPVLDHFSASTEDAALFTEDGAPSQHLAAMLNIPVIDDKLGFRVVGVFDHDGGWINQPAVGAKDYNSRNLSDVRFIGKWLPADRATLTFMAVIHRNDGANSAGEDSHGDYTQYLGLKSTPRSIDNYNLFNLVSSYNLDFANITESISYLDQNKANDNLGEALPLAPPGTKPLFQVVIPIQDIHDQKISDEFRVTSNNSNVWHWTLGGTYDRSLSSLSNPVEFEAYASVPPVPPTYFYSFGSHLDSDSWAVFGDLSYKLSDRITLGAGLRYFEDHETYASGLAVSAPETLGTTIKANFNSFDPRFYGQYYLGKDSNIYASASKGFRSGGFNSVGQPPYNPESLWTYEVGSKNTFYSGRVVANVSGFYSDYTNYQVSGEVFNGTSLTGLLSNAGDARVEGVEWELAWRFLDDWTIRTTGDYVTSRFEKITAIKSTYDVGDPLDFFPKYQIDTSVEHTFDVAGREGFWRIDYDLRGRETYRNRTYGSYYFSESSVLHMLKFNATLNWTPDLSFSLFGDNLLNDRGYVDPFSIQGLESRSRPRTFGVSLKAKFD